MKKTLNLCVVALAILLFASCSKNDDIKDNNIAKTNFERMYPQATAITWSNQENHAVAKFSYNMRKSKAWYDASGSWRLTETEIPLSAIPSAIKQAYDASQYANWRIEEVDYIERYGNEPFYVLEVELGDQEYDLYYLADGTLVKAFADDDKENNYLPKQLPEKAITYLQEKHPSYKLIDVDYEKRGIEVELIENTTKKEILFSTDGTWLKTTSDVAVHAIPKNILDILKTSQYSSYQIDEVEFVETPTLTYYEFELESKGQDIDLRIYMDGRIEVVDID